MSDQLRYPIGRFEMPADISPTQFEEYVLVLAKFPSVLQETLGLLEPPALEQPYREGGWTGRQVVHHLADSHMHCLIRCKWALSEEQPTIKPYLEGLWAELPDSKHFPLGASLQMLQGIHARLSYLLSNITPEQRLASYIHPESNRSFTLQQVAALYAWHCKHHLGHLLLLTKAK